MSTKLKFLGSILFFITVTSCSGGEKIFQVDAVAKQAQPFSSKDVVLLDGPFKHAALLDKKILLGYEPDRFLSNFRKNAGLKPKAEHYSGWESESLAGHSLGHYMSACSLMYQASGDKEFLSRVNYIVNELSACQEADGNGYIGAADGEKVIFENEVAKGNIRSQGFNLNGIWSPFYTQHKILAGLRDAYRLTGNHKALEIAKKFADWINTVISQLSKAQMQEVLRCEFGGMNEVLVDLYNDTNDGKYLEMASAFYDKAFMDNLVAQKDSLAGLHANTQIPKVIGWVKYYMATRNEDDYKAVTFFWNRVVNHHSYVTGGNGNHEYFGPPDKLSNRLSDETTETCNVYNMLKLSALLFQLNPSGKIADFYERALFNHILSSQNPENGHVTYNMSLEMGGYKYFQDPFAFTCCVGTGMENHAKYGNNIYYHNDKELYVFQFIASELNWKEKEMKVTQETKFPDEQGTSLVFTLNKPQKLTLKIRYPYWAEKGIDIKVNGKVFEIHQKPGSFVSINRLWNNGDRIDVTFPFTKRLEYMPDDSTRVAVMYGPLVMAGELGEVDDKNANNPEYVPIFMTKNKNPNIWMKSTDSLNVFKTIGIGKPREVRLKPFYEMYNKRYSVYWDLLTPKEWQLKQDLIRKEHEAYKQLEAHTFDFVQFGEMQSKQNHNFQGDKTYVVQMKGRKARQAERGGWFSVDVKVYRDNPTSLVFEYWGGYTGSKTFDIQVGGQTIATQDISGIKDGFFLDKKYDIPEDLTKGKQKVTVKIMPHEGNRGGPVFVIRTVKSQFDLKM